MRRLMENRKGDAFAIIIFVAIVFTIGIGLLVLMVFSNTFANVVLSSPLNVSAKTVEATQSFKNIGTAGFEQAFLGIFVVLMIGLFTSSFMIKIHPAFIFLYILTFGLAIVLSVFFSNAYGQIEDISIISDVVSQRPIMAFIMGHSVIITLVAGALSLILLFAKIFPSSGGDF